MTFRERQVTLVGPDGGAPGRLAWIRRGDRDWVVSLTGPPGHTEVTGTDLFAALTALRDRLEPHGWTVAVHGFRPGARPSGDYPTRVEVGEQIREMLADAQA
ncbi:hypothetical protein [Catenuloplanes japonicus]|uniref:hypothetical protein n=1 Tax=Catenuloplanes japonicus TaxID=33876 RepID=UPI0005272AE7|nr:hypothetical protein [Catenuloplanes japonicus]